MGDLDGRTVVVTGAASGLGRAFARGFLADGARVIGTDIFVNMLFPGMADTAIRGRDVPGTQASEVVHPTDRDDLRRRAAEGAS